MVWDIIKLALYAVVLVLSIKLIVMCVKMMRQR
jgi:hypothetical protein